MPWALVLLALTQASGEPPSIPAPPGACPALPKPRAGPLPFPIGELLTYDVDVLGARAGRMTFEVMPQPHFDAEIPVRVRAESNTFFDKLRKTKGEIVSTLRPHDLRPSKFHEEVVEGKLARVADVIFSPERVAHLTWRSNSSSEDGKASSPEARAAPGEAEYRKIAYANDGLDYVGGLFLFRSLPLQIGQSFCFDAYATKRMWRVEGSVEAREHISIPAGEFDAYHLSGVARSFTGDLKREIHVWLSDDARRLPLAAVGAFYLGSARATLVEIRRADLKAVRVKTSLEW
jgi:hypothetical protein